MVLVAQSPLLPKLSLVDDVQKTLREQIHSGRYQSGEWLPPERTLGLELKVHRKVVRAAIARLTEEGLLIRRPNCRPIVNVPERQNEDGNGEASKSPTEHTASRLVALVMWRGGGLLEKQETSQQRIFWGMNQELGQAGYHALFMDLGANIGSEEGNAEREAAHLQYALDHNFGGVVFYPYAYERNHELVKKVAREMPLIVIDRLLPGLDFDYVGIHNRQSFADAVTYLVSLGHRRIAHVTKSEPINTVQDRLRGYLQAMHDSFGRDCYEMVLVAPMFYGAEWPVFETVFRQDPNERPTAIICVNDYDAVYVQAKLRTLGLEVNKDVSLIGCDDVIPSLDNGVGLTTIAQPFEQIGTEAAKLYLRRTQESSAGYVHVELPATLVVRDSCRAV